MARTTPELIQGVMLDDFPLDENDEPLDVSPFILAATTLVSRLALGALENEVPVLDEELELIERWLAAHYISTPNRPLQSAKTGDASARYQGRTDMYLDATFYGQTAVTLDPTGYLLQFTTEGAKKGGPVTIGIEWLGTDDDGWPSGL
jgi:hypothetical protein